MSAFAEREEPYREAEFRFRTRDFPNEGKGAVWTDVLGHLRPAAIKAEMATTEYGEYENLLNETSYLLREIAIALGWKGADEQRPFSLNGLWKHATERQLEGWEPCRVDWKSV